MKSIFLIFSFFSLVAHADILFIDLNNADGEVAAASAAADKRGEKLIVFPPDHDSYANTTRHQLMDQRTIVGSHYHAKCLTPTALTDECDKMYRQYSSLTEQMQNVPGAKTYSTAQLKKDLAALPNPVTSVVVSGHDGSASFGGELGRLDAEDFIETFKNYSGRGNIRSLYLLGCNSAEAQNFGQTWKVALPNANFIAGYEGIGYLRDNPIGQNFISKALLQEPNILAASSIAKADQAFRGSFGGDKRHSVALCLTRPGEDPVVLSSSGKPKSLSQTLNCSPENTAKLEHLSQCLVSDSNPCPLRSMQDFPLERMKTSCLYSLKPEIRDSPEIFNKLYFLRQLADPDSFLSVRSSSAQSLFKVAPPRILSLLNIHPDQIETYPQVKQALGKLRDYYDHIDYNSLKSSSYKEFETLVREKKYYDGMWLSVSNLDLAKAADVQYSSRSVTPTSAAQLRAEAFAMAVQHGQTEQTFQQRINELQDSLKSADASESPATAIKAEIEQLSVYAKSADRKGSM